MNTIDEYLNIYKNKINDMIVKQGPTGEEIYQELCSYNSLNESLEEDVNQIVSYVDNAIKNYVGSNLKQGSDIDLVYINKNKGQYLKIINVYYNKHLPSITESIQIYLSISASQYKDTIINIINYLLKNRISFKTRISKINRNDNFVIALYSKKEALNIIEYIKNSSFKDYLNRLNPFIYQINNIGIVRDTNKVNYNRYVSNIIQEYIEECILKQQDNPYTSADLQRFIAHKCEQADNCIDKVMSYNLACFLYSIITNDDVFKRLNDEYIIKYDSEILKKYKVQIKDDKYHYYFNDQEVDFRNTIILNMNQCLYCMYKDLYGDSVDDYQLNSNIVNTMLNQLEEIISFKRCNIFLSYTNKNIQKLIPYLYAFIALKYKCCNDEECHKIIDTIEKKATFLDSVANNIYTYTLNNQIITSSLPIIQTSDGLCAIEYIDEEEKIVNIKIVKNGNIKSYLNVYIDVDNKLLNDSANYYGRLYRSAIASALLDEKRNENQLEKRKKDFAVKFITDLDEKVNKYVNIDSIKKIYHLKSKEISEN